TSAPGSRRSAAATCVSSSSSLLHVRGPEREVSGLEASGAERGCTKCPKATATVATITAKPPARNSPRTKDDGACEPPRRARGANGGKSAPSRPAKKLHNAYRARAP